MAEVVLQDPALSSLSPAFRIAINGLPHVRRTLLAFSLGAFHTIFSPYPQDRIFHGYLSFLSLHTICTYRMQSLLLILFFFKYLCIGSSWYLKPYYWNSYKTDYLNLFVCLQW